MVLLNPRALQWRNGQYKIQAHVGFQVYKYNVVRINPPAKQRSDYVQLATPSFIIRPRHRRNYFLDYARHGALFMPFHSKQTRLPPQLPQRTVANIYPEQYIIWPLQTLFSQHACWGIFLLPRITNSRGCVYPTPPPFVFAEHLHRFPSSPESVPPEGSAGSCCWRCRARGRSRCWRRTSPRCPCNRA